VRVVIGITARAAQRTFPRYLNRQRWALASQDLAPGFQEVGSLQGSKMTRTQQRFHEKFIVNGAAG
jgi:hypothetical protein